MNSRPPIVAILGHVDHGKTTLLDYIRKAKVASGEHGGITQRIGAYEVDTGIKGYPTSKITFIDTPGHEAFSQIRSRGATVADIAVLIIDAKDSLMPQTEESIFHIKNAKIPFIVALNKTDLPDAKPEKVKNDLLKHEIITEDKGGTVPTVEISGKTGKGVPELLESILLIAADQNLTYDIKHDPIAYIIETKKDRRGIVASAIIKDGVLRVTDNVYIDSKKTKIKAIINDVGKNVNEAIPSMPFELLGFEEMPEVGTDIRTKLMAEVEALEEAPKAKNTSDLHAFFEEKVVEKKLALVIKADAHGSLEAIKGALSKNPKVDLILMSVGDIHRSDIFLAKTTKAIVIGFSVSVNSEIRQLAKQEKVIIKTYNIIYELLDELTEASELLKEKAEEEKSIKGEAKVMANFIIEGEKICGVSITKGKINLGDHVELYRNNHVIGKTELVSLKHRAKTVDEVRKGEEAGMVFGPQLDVRVGDVVKFIS